MTASIATYPHEVLRTRLQTYRRLKGASVDTHGQVPGVVRMAKIIVRNEGWRALYRGLSVNLVRTVPNSAVTMLTCVASFLLCFPHLWVSIEYCSSTDGCEQIRDVNAISQRADTSMTHRTYDRPTSAIPTDTLYYIIFHHVFVCATELYLPRCIDISLACLSDRSFIRLNLTLVILPRCISLHMYTRIHLRSF